MKITNVIITSLNEAGNHFALGCEYKGARYHIWCDSNFNIDKMTGGGDNGTLFKNPPAGTAYKGPGYFSTRHLNADSLPSARLITEMIHWAKKTNMLATALAKRAEERAAEEVKHSAAMLEHRKEKMGPAFFELLNRVKDSVGWSSIYPELRADINEALAKVR
jgi:hypothetical protein